MIKDANGIPLVGVNISFWITNPNGEKIWEENSTTNQNGTVVPLITFSIASDDPLGNYTLNSSEVYYDQLAGKTVSGTSGYVFSVYVETTNMFTLGLEAPTEVQNGDKLIISATVTDGTKNIDPNTILASLYDPLGNLIIQNISMTKNATGLYKSEYQTSASSTQGSWRWVVMATSGTNTIIKEKLFYSALNGNGAIRIQSALTLSDLEFKNTGDYRIVTEVCERLLEDGYTDIVILEYLLDSYYLQGDYKNLIIYIPFQ